MWFSIMQRATQATSRGFFASDVRRLVQALRRALDVRAYRRIQAVLLVARGQSVSEVARSTATRHWSIYNWVRRYLHTHRPDCLRDAARSGRPRAAPRITDARIVAELRRDPLRLGYNTTGWTVPLLAEHLGRKYHCPISVPTLRRRMRRLGLRWKRPRYVYATKDPHRTQKKGRLFGN
jgi:transposase